MNAQQQGGSRGLRGRTKHATELAEQDFKDLDARVSGSRGYYDVIAPAHMNGAQFTAIVKGYLHKRPDLFAACVRNPEGLMGVLADCASKGLVPGDGYAITHFWNGETKIHDIVGMTEYTGELALIYRTSQVEAVVCEVVFPNDDYEPGIHLHDIPKFRRGGGRFASDKERGGDGIHTGEGAFGYAVYKDGGHSRIIAMSHDEIMLHRDAAKTRKIWDGDFWKSMWLKTIIHELYKWVPKSAEYQLELMRAQAMAISAPGAPALPAPPAGQPLNAPAPAELEAGNGYGGGIPEGTPAARAEVIRDDGPPPAAGNGGGQRSGQARRVQSDAAKAPSRSALRRIQAALDGWGLGEADVARVLRAVTSGAAGTVDELSRSEAADVEQAIDAAVSGQGDDPAEALAVLWRMVEGVETAEGPATS
jgi:recombinational DNA repair protein RecT